MAGRALKFVTVGDAAAEKTSFLVSFTHNILPGEYLPTVFDNYKAAVVVDGNPLELTIYDTAANSDFDRLRPLSYPDTDVFLICFSVVSKSSFESVSTLWSPEIQHHCPGTPTLLVGLKSDLRASTAIEECVTAEEATNLAASLGLVGYRECSAATQEGLQEVFLTAARSAQSQSSPTPTSGRKRQLLKNWVGKVTKKGTPS